MPVLEWREAARAGLLAIIDYISDDNPDAAQRLKDEIEAKVAKLPEHPTLYRPGRVVGTREMVIRPADCLCRWSGRRKAITKNVVHLPEGPSDNHTSRRSSSPSSMQSDGAKPISVGHADNH